MLSESFSSRAEAREANGGAREKDDWLTEGHLGVPHADGVQHCEHSGHYGVPVSPAAGSRGPTLGTRELSPVSTGCSQDVEIREETGVLAEWPFAMKTLNRPNVINLFQVPRTAAAV